MIRYICLSLAMAGPLVAQTTAPEARPVPADSTRLNDAAALVDGNGAVDPVTVVTGKRDQISVSDAAYATCLTSLDEIGTIYVEVEPVISDDDRDCGILRPLSVTEIIAGVAIQPAAVVRCDTALALANWTRDLVLPASERLPDRARLNVIENGSGYVCRRRNNLPDGKLSEHAFGNAFDIMAFGFEDGSRIAIEPREAEGSMEEAFQDAVRASACLEFSTVLGPGSNASHDDHIHVDIIERSSGYRLCEQGGGDPGK